MSEKLFVGGLVIWGVYLLRGTLNIKRQLQSQIDIISRRDRYIYQDVPLQVIISM